MGEYSVMQQKLKELQGNGLLDNPTWKCSWFSSGCRYRVISSIIYGALTLLHVQQRNVDVMLKCGLQFKH